MTLRRLLRTWLFARFLPSRSGSFRRRSRRDTAPVQSLEARIVPAVRIWDGGAAFNDRWSDPKNWVGDVAPQALDDLVFPAGIGLLDRSTNNDFLSGRTFRSIRFEAGDYKLTGNKIRLADGGRIESTATTGANRIEFNVDIGGGTNVFLTNNRMQFSGRLARVGSIDGKLQAASLGAGVVEFTGSILNTYSDPVEVVQGTLELTKTGGVRAISGPLIVGSVGTGTVATVRKPADVGPQLGTAPVIPVTVQSTAGASVLNLGNSNESIGALTLGGAIVTGAGELRLFEDVNTTSSPSGNIIQVGRLNLNTASRLFEVVGSNLTLRSQLTNGGLRKEGGRPLLISPNAANNTFEGNVFVREGELAIESLAGFTAVPGGIVTVGQDGSPAQLTILSDAALADAVGVIVRDGGATFGGQTGERLASLQVTKGDAFLLRPLTVDGALKVRLGGELRTNGQLLRVNGLTTLEDGTLIVQGSAQLMDGLELIAGRLEQSSGNPAANVLVQGRIDSKASAQPSRISGKLAQTLFLGINQAIGAENGAAAVDLIIDASIVSVARPVVKQGLGTVAFNGANDFFQTVTVQAGTLLVNGVHNNGIYVVESGGTLGGNGTVNQVRVEDGFLNPGASPGRLTSTGVVFTPEATFLVELNGPTAVTQFDQLDSNVQFENFGTPEFPTLDVRLGFNPVLGTEFALITGLPDTGVSGGRFKDPTGNVLDEGETFEINGLNFTISYQANGGDAVAIRRGNIAPAFENRRITNGVEGGLVTLSGRISEPDPLDDFFLDVNWGDGSPAETFRFPAGAPRNVSVTHRYRDDGRFNVALVWRDNHGASNAAALRTTISNVDPVINITGQSRNVRAGQLFNLAGIVRDAGLDDVIRLKINWGDGSPVQQITLQPSARQFVLQHVFRTAGRKRITLTAEDGDGGKVVLVVRPRILAP